MDAADRLISPADVTIDDPLARLQRALSREHEQREAAYLHALEEYGVLAARAGWLPQEQQEALSARIEGAFRPRAEPDLAAPLLDELGERVLDAALMAAAHEQRLATVRELQPDVQQPGASRQAMTPHQALKSGAIERIVGVDEVSPPSAVDALRPLIGDARADRLAAQLTLVRELQERLPDAWIQRRRDELGPPRIDSDDDHLLRSLMYVEEAQRRWYHAAAQETEFSVVTPPGHVVDAIGERPAEPGPERDRYDAVTREIETRRLLCETAPGPDLG